MYVVTEARKRIIDGSFDAWKKESIEIFKTRL
jgi:hypothetical protein